MCVQQLQKTYGKALLVAGVMSLAWTSAQARDWSDTFIGFRYGTDFTEPGVQGKVQKEIYQLGHASGNESGSNFINLDVLKSDSNNPKKDSDSGATEAYLVYRHQLFLSKVFERSMAFGPVKEVAFSGGVELNYKNTEFANPNGKLVIVQAANRKLANEPVCRPDYLARRPVWSGPENLSHHRVITHGFPMSTKNSVGRCISQVHISSI